MINAAIVGLGWWGKTLVESVSGISDDIRFVAATTRSLSDDAKEFATEHDLELRTSYEDILTDPNIDAVVLVTPNSLHSAQTIAAAEQGKHVFCETKQTQPPPLKPATKPALRWGLATIAASIRK